LMTGLPAEVQKPKKDPVSFGYTCLCIVIIFQFKSYNKIVLLKEQNNFNNLPSLNTKFITLFGWVIYAKYRSWQKLHLEINADII